jgi:hypothetical protein
MSVGTHQENREALPARLPADRFHEIRAGRAPDPRSQETTEQHNRKAVRRYESGTLIGSAELGLLLQFHDVIEIERADAEIIAALGCVLI